jgi:primosomal protein N' (replication factor Y)
VISVAVPVPFLDLLTYRVPPGIELPPVGARVRVPVGTRAVTGVVVEHSTWQPPSNAAGWGPPSGGPGGSPGAAPSELKTILEVIDHEPYVPAHVVELCRWVADYYVAGIGDALAMAMPPGARNRASGYKTRRVAKLNAATVTVEADLQVRLTVFRGNGNYGEDST